MFRFNLKVQRSKHLKQIESLFIATKSLYLALVVLITQENQISIQEIIYSYLTFPTTVNYPQISTQP